jgi:serine protease inhibitor
MRQWNRTFMAATSAAALAAAALATGCAEKNMTGPEPQEPVRPFTAVEQQVSGASTAFGLGLLRELSEPAQQENLLISPLSVSMALGMTLNGAVGETFDAMRTTLGFGDMSEAQVNAAYRGLIAQLRARDPKVEFRLANAIWYRQGFAVKQPFLDAVRQNFSAEVASLDFASPTAPRTISRWAEDATGGRIKDLVESIHPLDRMFLVNAVYFRAAWTRPFEPASTQPGPFTRGDGSTTSVPLMRMDAYIPFLGDGAVQMVELAYADSAFAMVLLAPADGSSLDELVAQLTPARWTGLLAQLQPNRVMLTMPKFRFDYGARLNDALDRLGMGIAFLPRAGFMRIAEVDDLHISRVQHKSFIDVHELGTEAAAATSVTVGVTSMPPELRFDRPFLFAIHERSSGTLLFLGRVNDPSR